jgi:hypothetical protein
MRCHTAVCRRTEDVPAPPSRLTGTGAPLFAFKPETGGSMDVDLVLPLQHLSHNDDPSGLL